MLNNNPRFVPVDEGEVRVRSILRLRGPFQAVRRGRGMVLMPMRVRNQLPRNNGEGPQMVNVRYGIGMRQDQGRAPPPEEAGERRGGGGQGRRGARILDNYARMDNEGDGTDGAAAVGEVVQIECEISEELSSQVFENDMLREMILEYVIYPNPKGKAKGKVSRSDVRNLRLVGKNWLGTVAGSMRKLREPMFALTSSWDNSSSKSKLLDRFVRAMVSTTRLPDFIPPFSLKLLPDFFRRENHQNLSDLLTSCGESLVSFDLSFPINSSMTFAFPSFHLPQLHHLSIQFSDQRLTSSVVGGIAIELIEYYGHAIYPLQTILRETVELKELTFKFTTSPGLIPFGFEYLVLPDTITVLGFNCPVKDSHLQLLIKNDLPNLTSLRLFATNSPLSRGTVFNILEKFQKTLHSLSLNGQAYRGRVRNTNLFKLPLMENLEALTVTSQCWQLEDDLNHLERQLPKMSELKILNTRDDMFTKWIENSKYEAVKRLTVTLIDVNVTSHSHVPHHAEVPMTITLEKMISLHVAFPNVVNLRIKFFGPFGCALKYLFTEMRNLKKLAIAVKESGEVVHPGQWDSILIGMPPDMVLSFRKNPNFLEMMNLQDDENFPSIRKLTALKSLTLVDVTFAPVSESQALISDLAFHFAFFKMPNLKNLLLHGRFLASAKMTERWKQEKGTEISGINDCEP